MIGKTLSAGILGIDAYLVTVEVDIRRAQLSKWNTVGLPESAVKESKDRVIAAIRNSSYDFSFQKVTINLAPADTKKEGTAYDLPIALALLMASKNDHFVFDADTIFIGELSLSGDLRPVRGVLPIAVMARDKKIKRLIVPLENANEAAMVSEVDVYGFLNLAQVVEFILGNSKVEPIKTSEPEQLSSVSFNVGDMSEIYGQHQAKRALEIAASGGHNILLSGPPGSGKTMLASRIPGILPPLTFDESLETSKIYSVVGLLKSQSRLLTDRPFRNPHHSISNAGLIGGGTYPKPGEVSLAHNGVLFLDELPEFQKHVLELMRQPLESHEVTISRSAACIVYPARFILVASCNPCPCGYLGHSKIECHCADSQIQRYKSRLSGPLLDRIDLLIQVPPVPFEEYRKKSKGQETSFTVRDRVKKARDIQLERFKGTGIWVNSQMTTKLIEQHCDIDSEGEKILKTAVERFHLSARAIGRILRVSRTIADLGQVESIQLEHILEAIQYRCVESREAN